MKKEFSLVEFLSSSFDVIFRECNAGFGLLVSLDEQNLILSQFLLWSVKFCTSFIYVFDGQLKAEIYFKIRGIKSSDAELTHLPESVLGKMHKILKNTLLLYALSCFAYSKDETES